MEKTYEVNFGGKAIILHAVLICFAIGFFTIWSPLVAKWSQKMTINRKRVSGEIGILRKVTLDAPISKISSVMLSQGIFGRMLDYGTIKINTYGDNADYIFTYVDNPKQVKKLLNELIDKTTN